MPLSHSVSFPFPLVTALMHGLMAAGLLELAIVAMTWRGREVTRPPGRKRPSPSVQLTLLAGLTTVVEAATGSLFDAKAWQVRRRPSRSR